MDWFPIDNATLGLKFSYLSAEYGDFVLGEETLFAENPIVPGISSPEGEPPPRGYAVDGLTPPLSPDYTITLTGKYDFDLGDDWGTLTPGFTFFASDSYRTNDTPLFFAVQDSYTRTDLYVNWQSADERFSVQFFVNNLEDEAVLNFTTPNTGGIIFENYADPRVYGLRLSFHN